MRDYDNELRNAAKIKKSADATFQSKLETGLRLLHALYAGGLVVVALTVWLFTMRFELTREINDRKDDRKAYLEQRERDWNIYYEQKKELLSTYKSNRYEDRKLLNQVYIKMFGVEITFGQ